MTFQGLDRQTDRQTVNSKFNVYDRIKIIALPFSRMKDINIAGQERRARSQGQLVSHHLIHCWNDLIIHLFLSPLFIFSLLQVTRVLLEAQHSIYLAAGTFTPA